MAAFYHTEGLDVYYGVNPRRRSGGRAALLGAVCCHADVDADTWDRSAVPAPHLEVHSGRGWHLYWFLDRMTPVEAVEPVNRGLANALGADHCWDASRILRVPGTVNHKNDSPCVVTAVGRGLPRITPEALAALPHADVPAFCALDADVPSAEYTRELEADEVTFAEAAYERDDIEDRSGADFSVALKGLRSGLTVASVARLLYHAPWGKARERGARYISRTLARAAAVVEREAEVLDEMAPSLEALV